MLGVQAHMALCLAFCLDAWDLDSDVPVFTASTLQIEPSSQPPVSTLLPQIELGGTRVFYMLGRCLPLNPIPILILL